jgi:hypothetical protein
MVRTGTIVLALALGCGLSGCAGPSDSGPRRAASDFATAWAQRDGAAVCDLLAPETAAEVAQSAGTSCAAGVLDEQLPREAAPEQLQVWGRAAQARSTTDTLFLARLPDGWRVTAAGCRPQSGKPYDCQLEGG